jgi:predicted porin
VVNPAALHDFWLSLVGAVARSSCYAGALMIHTKRSIGAAPFARGAAPLSILAVLCCASRASADGIHTDIEIYGTLLPTLELIDTDGGTSAANAANATQVPLASYTGFDEPRRLRMTQGTSNIGFRGSFDLLGDTLSVVWQIESGVPIDGDPAVNTIASRNSRLGIKGNWGTFFFGIWDNPYKWASLPVINPIAAGFVADQTAIMSTPGFNVGALNLTPGYVANAVPGPSPVPRSNAAFYRRDSNSIQYWSPQFYGLSARVSYTANEFSRADRPASSTVGGMHVSSPDVFSGLLSYDNGPLQLRYGVEMHRNYFGLSLLGGAPGPALTNPTSQDVAQQVVAAYTIKFNDRVTTRLVANFDYLFYENDDEIGGHVDQYQRPAFYGLVEQSFARHHLWAAYGLATAGRCSLVGNGPCSTDGLGAHEMTLGYLYRAAPSTDFYAFAYQVVNNRAASYTPFPSVDPQPSPGSNVRSVGIGMLYRFSATASTEL